MSSHHGWAGDPASWVAVQLPDAGALGVVICPPLGQEGVVAYRGLRFLADELERRGVASVRYDPPGRGDGAPCDDPDAPVVGAQTAAAVLRASGCTQIAFLGLSSAALIASEAAGENDLLVLWSPPASGRLWLRRSRSLATMELGADRTDGEIESLIGLDLTAAQAAALGAIRLTLPVNAPSLLAIRPEEQAPSGLEAAELIRVSGTAEFVDTASMASVIPQAAIAAITDWLVAHASPASTPLQVSGLVDRLELGTAVETIRWLGPQRLFAIECSPLVVTATTPMVLLHAGGAEHRVGAGDYQVELARLLAADGAASLRVDRRGTGETGPVLPGEPALFYSDAWLSDQDEVVAELGLPGDRLALTGLCAGGWIAGLSQNLTSRLSVVIHPLEYRTDPAGPGEYTEVTFAEQPGVKQERSGLRQWYLERAPMWLRRLRDKWMGRSTVAPFLQVAAAHSEHTVLIFSDLERMIFDRRGGPEAARRLANVELVDLSTSDHALFSRRARVRVIGEIRRQVDLAFGLTPAP